MSYQLHHKQKFEDLDYRLNNLDELRRIANGGNSVLFTYSPNEEALYINKAIELYSSKAEFIVSSSKPDFSLSVLISSCSVNVSEIRKELLRISF